MALLTTRTNVGDLRARAEPKGCCARNLVVADEQRLPPDQSWGWAWPDGEQACTDEREDPFAAAGCGLRGHRAVSGGIRAGLATPSRRRCPGNGNQIQSHTRMKSSALPIRTALSSVVHSADVRIRQ